MDSNDNEYLLKLATIREYQDVLAYKRSYEEMMHEFLGLFKEFIRYCEMNRTAIPEKERLFRIVSHVQNLIQRGRPTKGNTETILSPTAEEVTEPWVRFCLIFGCF